MKKTLWFILLVFVAGFQTFPQNSAVDDSLVIKKIQADICILASDSMIGRETGTPGEWMARKYIESRFKEIGLQSLFDTSYFEAFEYFDSDFVDLGTFFELNGKALKLYLDYYPLGFSSNDTVSGEMVFVGTGIYNEREKVNDYAGLGDLKNKIFIMDLAIPDKYLKNNDLWESTQKVSRVNLAAERGAKAVIFFSSDKSYGIPVKNPSFFIERCNIPVVFLMDASLIDVKNPGKANVGVNIKRSGNRKAWNVGAYLDNHAEYTVVIGAHYDHLGMGFSGTRDAGNYEVHNGADDNASGVAGVLEIAEMLVHSDMKNNNYIFLAFSAEEKGLIGSAKFLEKESYPQEKLNYMIDLDMIGRLDDKNNLKIYGTGTSNVWDDAIDRISNPEMKVTKIKTGIGGSDHTSFNQKQIPAIFIHTGLHADYHKAVDDCELINFSGLNEVMKYTYNIIKFLDKAGKISYRPATVIDEILIK
ncbi:MAG: M20/M25/M40 family metallo-hydrolase [Bacteroidales bacterium]|jgi:hypothetical protein|nr:M20/M25/M40 family metallo-hydrolase [Bacteroidales bacterium]MDD4215656.1 M20/M25/M40 family metallo-hydrolase [Bacteroidales bacterium]